MFMISMAGYSGYPAIATVPARSIEELLLKQSIPLIADMSCCRWN